GNERHHRADRLGPGARAPLRRAEPQYDSRRCGGRDPERRAARGPGVPRWRGALSHTCDGATAFLTTRSGHPSHSAGSLRVTSITTPGHRAVWLSGVTIPFRPITPTRLQAKGG